MKVRNIFIEETVTGSEFEEMASKIPRRKVSAVSALLTQRVSVRFKIFRGCYMLRKIQILLLVMIMLTAIVSLSHAYPADDTYIRMTPFWQNRVPQWSSKIMGCQDSDAACYSDPQWANGRQTIGWVGCTLTSMAMLYYAYGFKVIPDLNHKPTPCNGGICMMRLNPGNLNDYLSGSDPSGGLLGFNPNHDLNWYKTTTNLYYWDDSPGAVAKLAQ